MLQARCLTREVTELMAMAVIGLIVQPATGLLYGRLSGGPRERANTIVDMCWRALS